ncbi:unnamed protein product [Menidia menidia]|uniref:(Atlantic silverside) hypothetical protein n=1 Tax=Menidia menidia TaxID=238744 RepID=A0A8S4ALU8_9TELE|nr:unnamed protein product [Menidia menidia]
MEEWRQCGRWLIDCKVLPPNHRVVWPSAAVFDLAQALRDGVLLCQMLHNLSPGSVDLKEINFRPQMSQVSKLRHRAGGRARDFLGNLISVLGLLLTHDPSARRMQRAVGSCKMNECEVVKALSPQCAQQNESKAASVETGVGKRSSGSYA